MGVGSYLCVCIHVEVRGVGAESGLPQGHLHRDALPSLSGGDNKKLRVGVRARSQTSTTSRF